MEHRPGHTMKNEKHRIAKIIALRSGLSRRKAEQAIQDGRIHVNHELITKPNYTISEKDKVWLDHEPLTTIRPFIIAYHKPPGFVCSHAPQKNQTSIYTQLSKHHDPPTTFLRHVGRLDIASEGLLLLTNCPQTAHTLQNKAWKKIYKVRTQGIITPENLNTLTRLRRIDNAPITPMNISLLRTTKTNSWTQWVLSEGRYRQIRIALTHIRSRASRIIRTHFGPFLLDSIPPGKHIVIPNKALHKLMMSH